MSPLSSPPPLAPEAFPILRAAHRFPENFDADLADITEALALGFITNLDFKRLKSRFDSAAERAWDKTVLDPFFNRGLWRGQDEEVKALQDQILITTLHAVIGAANHIEKSRAPACPAVDAMRAYTAEALPLAEAMWTLKALKTSRRRGAAPAPVNPRKLVKTCSWCLRSIAVKGAGMAHHGYQRPGGGHQTMSCEGMSFPALEFSDAGLRAHIKNCRVWREQAARMLQEADSLTTLSVQVGRGAHRKFENLTPQDAGWSRSLAAVKEQRRQRLAYLDAQLPALIARLRAWHPETHTGAAPRRFLSKEEALGASSRVGWWYRLADDGATASYEATHVVVADESALEGCVAVRNASGEIFPLARELIPDNAAPEDMVWDQDVQAYASIALWLR